MIPSLVIFIIAYILIATDRLDKTTVVLIGAGLMLFFRLITFENAVAAIDLNVIFLLVGMMTSVFVLAKTGFFEWVAIIVAKLARGNPMLITLLFLIVTAILSAFLDNVTTIILLAPVTILIMQILEISPVPLLILEVIASNIGGAATLIGDPPNIIVGSQANLSFNDFLINLFPVVSVMFVVFLLTVYILFRRRWNISGQIRKRVIESVPHLAIIDRKNMIKALVVLSFIFLGFFTHTLTGVKPGVIALFGAMVMTLVCKVEIDRTFKSVEWSVVFFFIGLFMMVAALEHNGVIEFLAQGLLNAAGSNLFILCVVILCGSALLSSVLDNIPFVVTMIPMVKSIIGKVSLSYGLADASLIQAQIAYPLWWSLVLGVCLGGNGTLIGASANVVMAKISQRNKYPVSFMKFSKYGFPFMLQTLVISVLYIWIRYFL
ncbi:MAG: ArsB/NhaD family transporter [Candidatus Omnitrophica bacterium]|nr:ArsB/NhaD family transporter [Candidatus Omnitrophota bacterium]MDD5429677.1 ArsB/NhaD family transporter [Candidatus Omnitrophota bacterium]